MDYDVVIVGSGPAGYLSAIRISQLGGRVLIIDRDRIGGECLNYACIPSKTIIHHLRIIYESQRLINDGVLDGSLRINIDSLRAIKDDAIKTISRGILYLFKRYGVKFIKGDVRNIRDGVVSVNINGRVERFKGNIIILATGTKPRKIHFLPRNDKLVWDNRVALNIKNIPGRVAIIGGGATGVEIASIYWMLGSRIHLIEVMDRLLPGLDKDLGATLGRIFSGYGIDVRVGASIREVMSSGNGLKILLEAGRGTSIVDVECVVNAIGREPCIDIKGDVEGLDRDEAGFIRVGERQETNIDYIYAIGDVTGPPLLAHKAYWDALNVSESLFGEGPIRKPRNYPNLIHSIPEILSIGISGDPSSGLIVSKYPFRALGRAIADRYVEGFIKIVADPSTHKILGIHCIGMEASRMAGLASILVESGIRIEEAASISYPHPTYSEAIWEALRLSLGKPLHWA